MSKSERQKRWDVCIGYLKRAGSLPAAMKLAKSESGVSFNTSVWITALSKMLAERTLKTEVNA